MKRMTVVVAVMLILGFSFEAHAAFTFIDESGSNGETVLTGDGGVLDQIYEWDNLIRVDDDDDQLWPTAGLLLPPDLVTLWNEGADTVFPLFTNANILGIDYIIFGLENQTTEIDFWSFELLNIFSDPANPDHMVTFRDTVNAGVFYVGWEDRANGDMDFNDLVYRITFDADPVPEPATIVLLMTGLIGLAGAGRKRFRI